jgi:hypothetical protein
VGGGRVLVFDDRRGINFSPLRDVAEARFVHDDLELAQAIESFREGDRGSPTEAREFFTIDPGLPRWRAYFDLARQAEIAQTADETMREADALRAS